MEKISKKTKQTFIPWVVCICIALGSFSEAMGNGPLPAQDPEANSTLLRNSAQSQNNKKTRPSEKSFVRKHPFVAALAGSVVFAVGGTTLVTAGLGVYCAVTCKLNVLSCLTALGTCPQTNETNFLSAAPDFESLRPNFTHTINGTVKRVPVNFGPTGECPPGTQVGRLQGVCNWPGYRFQAPTGHTSVCGSDYQWRLCETTTSGPQCPEGMEYGGSGGLCDRPGSYAVEFRGRVRVCGSDYQQYVCKTKTSGRTIQCAQGMKDYGSQGYPCDYPGLSVLQSPSNILMCGPDYQWHTCKPETDRHRPGILIDARTQHECSSVKGMQCWTAWGNGQQGEILVEQQEPNCGYGAPVACPPFVSGEAVCWPRTCGGMEVRKPDRLFDISWQCSEENSYEPDIKTWPCSTSSLDNQRAITAAFEEWSQWIVGIKGSNKPHEIHMTIKSIDYPSGSTVLADTALMEENTENFPIYGVMRMGRGGAPRLYTHEFGHIILVPAPQRFQHYVQNNNFCSPEVNRYFGRCIAVIDGHWDENARDSWGNPINIQPMKSYDEEYTGISTLSLLALRDMGYVVLNQPAPGMGFRKQASPPWYGPYAG